ncbi:MAG: ATP-binding protein [Patescibacteria group bacterium]
MKTNNWYIITGAPHAGKTTLIEALENLGHTVMFEAAREYIDEEMKMGKTIREIREDELEFQKKILAMKIEKENKASREELIFWDRGIPDSMAYYEMLGVAEDPFLQKAMENAVYKKVFLLQPLAYKKDYARTESEEQQRMIHELLKKAYLAHGCELVEVGGDVFEKRLESILKNL